MDEYDHILSKYDLFFMFVVEKYEKSGFSKQSFLQKSLESAKFTTLHSLIAEHVL